MNTNCSMLTEEEMSMIKKTLEIKKENLRNNREFRLSQIKDSGEVLKDAADMAGHEEDLEKMWFFLNRDQNNEQKVGEALKRIDNGTYGTCKECDGPISFKRLQIDPTSELCIFCKNELELEESNSRTHQLH
ncbi:MAG: TraR/DksA family transcriptional regulator [Oligoflexia bacterium]|nr:TraR/DksA family transcriptional regulator [Oligoflexia bacterium]